MQKITIISDITRQNIADTDAVRVYEEFGFESPYDCGILSIDTTKDELEALFQKKLDRNGIHTGCCFVCDFPIAQRILDDCADTHTSISEYINRLKEQSLSMALWDKNGEYRVDFCFGCIEKYFEKFITYSE